MSLRRSFATLTKGLRPTIRQLLSQSSQASPTTPIQVNGWVKSVRRQKRVAFAVITDGSSPLGLQAVFLDPALARSLTNGAAVRLTGMLANSIGAGQAKELQVHTVDIVGECNPEILTTILSMQTYPIQKKALTTEYLRDHCHLRTRTDEGASVVRLRHDTLNALHSYFQAQGFCYAHTPLVTSSDCEGAGETFRIGTLLSSQSSGDKEADKQPPEFFGRPAYLTVSAQLHLEALSASISRVFTISPCFRAERSQTGRHLAEFWMLEAEWAFTESVDDLCQVAEDAIKSTLRQPSADLAALQTGMDPSRAKILQDAARPDRWPRITYTEAIIELEKVQASRRLFEFPVGWGRTLQSEHERWVAEHLVGGPVFVTDYPTQLKPFYMRQNVEGDTVACFDLLVPHLGELIGGSLREEREDKLLQAIEHHGLNLEDYKWYVDLRKYGGAPHGGFGLGFERLISWLSGIENIRECIPMPRWAGRMLL
ncbi:hypothetical protein BDY19DRAFT_893183 [Irpex rosettiformis]|uniref:Uncharacterized protein n=1 Tax=Irpex rosettiformis TaxID=378272 RepID=A0ACB8TZI6_9APHY|nr:hypothetical protein BDY19DRAFT_893183 [Irpex rosettiformis]